MTLEHTNSSVRLHRTAQAAPRLVGLVLVLSLLASTGCDAATGADPSTSAPPPAPVSVGDGLMRDSLTDFTSLEPMPQPLPSSLAPAPAPRSHAVAHRHRRVRHPQVPPPPDPPQVTIQGHRPRNPVTGFVYWWNGWVIKTFHTKIGTVMLGTVGAKTS